MLLYFEHICLIQAHPDYDYYRGRSVVNYEKFAIIYGDSIADGRDVMLTNQRPPHPMEAPYASIHDVAAESSSFDKITQLTILAYIHICI